MQTYHTIDYYGQYWHLPVHAFEKLDGSNMRFEYSQKRGFYKFGTRNQMIDRSSSEFSFGIDLFLNRYEKLLTDIFKSKDYRNTQNFVCYAELFGEKSEFGRHDLKNDSFQTTLFDIENTKTGFIPPKQFIKDFGGNDGENIPRVIYTGNLSKEFVKSIKESKELKEGCVCKGVIQNNKRTNLYYCKIKTNDWFDRLRGTNPELFQQEIAQQNLTVKNF